MVCLRECEAVLIQLPLYRHELGHSEQPVSVHLFYVVRKEVLHTLIRRDNGIPAECHHVEEIPVGNVLPPALMQSRHRQHVLAAEEVLGRAVVFEGKKLPQLVEILALHRLTLLV